MREMKKKRKRRRIENLCKESPIKSMFKSVVAVAFQSVFHAEMHQNNIFFKIIFEIGASKRSKTYKKN
jgi:hypothetical protein